MLKPLIRHVLGFANVGWFFRRRARSRRLRDKTFLIFEGRRWSYAECYREAVRYANLFESIRQQRVAAGALAPDAQLPIGVYQENTPEFVFAYFGAALSGAVLFGINTGFRGETLATLCNQGELQLLMTEPAFLPRVEDVMDDLETLDSSKLLLSGPPAESGNWRPIGRAIDELRGEIGGAIDKRPRVRIDNLGPFIVIYTSGTTGLPKGVPCSQFKLVGVGVVTRRRIGLRADDRGYICMPLFHSNSWFLGIMPLLDAGGSVVVRRKFSASAFEEDILEHGVTYLNYVGQPIHYILHALEAKYSGGDAVETALARHPGNRFRIAHGNGATPIDRKKLVRYLGMEHIYELYGATEAAISTYIKPGDPLDSVGEVTSKAVVILDERGEECPPGEVDASGRLVNYDRAVGEICRKIKTDNIFFDGYFKNPGATSKKFRDGYFHSGDLGHIQIADGKRYLYFDGRTDDWIRKDGENFSAENVAQYAGAQPGVALAVAYGAPAEVADEKVMVAVKLADGADFDPQSTFDYYMEQQREGGMDPKWMPDYIRVVPEFEMTKTEKILVRPLKQRHFRLDAGGDGERIYYRRRGDETYHLMTDEAYAEIAAEFEDNGRERLL